MAITRQKKEEILNKLSGVAKDASSVVFVNFHGLGVDDVNEMRRDFKEKGVEYFVAKKTLAKKAFGESSIKGERPAFEGELAVAWGDDPVVPAGSIYAFSKKFDGAVSITGGVFEGEYKNQEEMLEIAQIPPKEVLLGMFVNLLNSPLQRYAIALDQIAKTKEA